MPDDVDLDGATINVHRSLAQLAGVDWSSTRPSLPPAVGRPP
jgi:hypothetical protein